MTREIDEQSVPAQVVAQLARILVAQQSLEQVLERVADLGREAVPAAEAVSITLVRDDKAWTAALSGDFALPLDERQYELGYGPCISAAAAGITIAVSGDTDLTYPDFARHAAQLGVGSTLAVGFPVAQATQGALNLYTRGGSFDEQAMLTAQGFAGYAAVALANAALYTDAVTLARQMTEALESRAVIDQAKGIIIRDTGVDADQAFDILVQASMRSNRKLRDIAVAMVEKARSRD